MTWSKLVTGIRESFQRSSRNGRKIDRIIIHHTATTNGEWVLDAMVSGSKQVSANYVPDKDGKLWGVVNEDFRAWTSSSASWDGRSITMECVNNSTDGWTISNASYEKIAQLLADISIRYNFPLTRDKQRSTVLGHKELYLYWGDSYATACPGGIDIDRIVRRANEIKGSLPAGGGSEGAEVKVYRRTDGTAASAKGRTVKAGGSFWLNTTNGADVSKATNIVGGIGEYSLTTHVYADGGVPGEKVDVQLYWDNTKTTGPHSGHYVQTFVFDKDGKIRDQVEFKRGVTAGYAVYANFKSHSTKDIKVTVFATDAYLFLA